MTLEKWAFRFGAVAVGLAVIAAIMALLIDPVSAGVVAVIAAIVGAVAWYFSDRATANKDTAVAADLGELHRKSLPRSVTFDTEAFVAELKDQPKAPFTIWYVPGDDEAYDLAFRISGGLRLAGWEPSFLPVPIPETETHHALAGSVIAATMPPLRRVGGQYGVTLMARTMPVGALMRAITRGTGGQVAAFADDRMPEGVIRVIVGPKP